MTDQNGRPGMRSLSASGEASVRNDPDATDGVRSILSNESVTCGGLSFAFITESVKAPTDWQFSDPEHILVVHRSGALATMDVEFERGPSGPALPEVGHLWSIPAERRYAALAQGDSVTFCEIRLPTAVFGDREMAATVQHRDPFALQLINRMSGLIGRDDVSARLLLESLADTFRLHIAGTMLSPALAPAESGLVSAWSTRSRTKVARYIEEHLASSFTAADLAELMGVNVSEFSRMFKKSFNTTLHQYVLAERIRLAKSLLVTSPKSITEIGREVGFFDSSHFATTFRQRTGVTASEYRRNG